MVLEWLDGGAIEVNDGLELPQFNLIDVQEEKCTKSYSTGQNLVLHFRIPFHSKDIS